MFHLTDWSAPPSLQVEKLRASGWQAVGSFPGTGKDGAAPKTLRFNIGGQVFEAAEAVLKRDPDSLLAALCSKDSPMQLKDDGAFYFDRDWWVGQLCCRRRTDRWGPVAAACLLDHCASVMRAGGCSGTS